jgi:hypothetical protein
MSSRIGDRPSDTLFYESNRTIDIIRRRILGELTGKSIASIHDSILTTRFRV